MLLVRLWIAAISIVAVSCAQSGYRVDRVEGGETTVLPLEFDSVSGARNGDTIRAEVTFAHEADTIDMNIIIHLSPTAECTSGNYHAVIAGQSSEGSVRCQSLAFQGGQDSPAVGGVFLLTDNSGIAKYKITMPSTQMQRRFSP
jgi:hypothetical protein